MGRHNVHLVDAEAEHYVQHHVEGKVRHDQPHEARAASCPYTEDEEQHDDALHHIVEGITVVHYYRSRPQHVVQEVVLMYLYRLAKKVLHD